MGDMASAYNTIRSDGCETCGWIKEPGTRGKFSNFLILTIINDSNRQMPDYDELCDGLLINKNTQREKYAAISTKLLLFIS
jgi:hypothetical protein